MADNVLEVKHLRVEFPTRKGLLVAVDDVNFEIVKFWDSLVSPEPGNP